MNQEVTKLEIEHLRFVLKVQEYIYNHRNDKEVLKEVKDFVKSTRISINTLEMNCDNPETAHNVPTM